MPLIMSIGPEETSDPDQIKIFEHTFTIRRVTRSIQKKLEIADKKLNDTLASPDSDGDAVVTAIAEGVDLLLAPNGQKTAAKTVLLKHWRADELTVDQVHQLYEGMQEAAAKRPPTSLAVT